MITKLFGKFARAKTFVAVLAGFDSKLSALPVAHGVVVSPRDTYPLASKLADTHTARPDTRSLPARQAKLPTGDLAMARINRREKSA